MFDNFGCEGDYFVSNQSFSSIMIEDFSSGSSSIKGLKEIYIDISKFFLFRMCKITFKSKLKPPNGSLLRQKNATEVLNEN